MKPRRKTSREQQKEDLLEKNQVVMKGPWGKASGGI